jgi:hypothetical protein
MMDQLEMQQIKLRLKLQQEKWIKFSEVLIRQPRMISKLQPENLEILSEPFLENGPMRLKEFWSMTWVAMRIALYKQDGTESIHRSSMENVDATSQSDLKKLLTGLLKIS